VFRPCSVQRDVTFVLVPALRRFIYCLAVPKTCHGAELESVFQLLTSYIILLGCIQSVSTLALQVYVNSDVSSVEKENSGVFVCFSPFKLWTQLACFHDVL
jgi:hypothetical protein